MRKREYLNVQILILYIKISSPIEIALRFVEYINEGDAEGLTTLMTEDFIFIDKAGETTYGRQRWDYFSQYPQYRIHVKHILTSGDAVAIIGKTTDSHVPRELEEKEHVLWIAVIRNDLVSQWRIYSDIDEIKKTDESIRDKR
ncbi:MAG: nuclear transport factor 2 family protein [Theionarchaea archaeon]|nr:nuclear transport factor 2 family protein [Theionarchaea archaeon]